jgi:hypothetical protein
MITKKVNAQRSLTIKRNGLILMATAVILATCSAVRAGELGHFNPGVANIRDFVVPEPGFYAMLYNYYYTSNRLNDRDGNKVHSVTIDPPGGKPDLTFKADVDLDLYALSPLLLWVSPWEVAGARYAAYVAPSFATSSLGASLAVAHGQEISGDLDSSFGRGDLIVQPLWLGWSMIHWDLALGYGFYAPIGRYEVETVTFPVVGPQKVEAKDNIGLGFWTHQIQGAAAWYPWAHRGTAMLAALTYEINHEKEDFDITPGSHLTLNWGVSQYLPLSTDRRWVLEIGPAGYSQWKVTDDTGSDARNGSVHDQVHAAGWQVGLVYSPWNAALSFRYLYELASEARFQGQVLGLNLALKY